MIALKDASAAGHYLVIFDGFQIAGHVKTGQSHHFGSQIKANVQYSSHSVRVKEWQQANVRFLMLTF